MKMFKYLVVILVGLMILGGASAASAWWYLTQPAAKSSQETVSFVIPKGQALSIIASRLHEAGLIRHPLVFRAIVRQQNLGSKIQAGSFELSPAMSTEEIAVALTEGTNDVWITLLEGWRMEEIADYLDEQGLPAYDKQQFLEIAADSEGYLYPDSYLIPKLATAQQIHSLLRNTFSTKVEVGLAPEIDAANRSLEEVVIVASILEREGRGYEQMRVIAGVLENRIELGMPLQVDASLQYIKGYDSRRQDWWVPPTAADKQLNSPFNTYQNPGLPPQPIANPSLDAVKAALNPVETDYLFYIHDNQGVVRFAETLEEHNQNIDQYLR